MNCKVVQGEPKHHRPSGGAGEIQGESVRRCWFVTLRVPWVESETDPGPWRARKHPPPSQTAPGRPVAVLISNGTWYTCKFSLTSCSVRAVFLKWLLMWEQWVEGPFRRQGRRKGASDPPGLVPKPTREDVLLMTSHRSWQEECKNRCICSLVLAVQLTGHADLWGQEEEIHKLSRVLAGRFLGGESNGPFDGRVDRLADSPDAGAGGDCVGASPALLRLRHV